MPVLLACDELQDPQVYLVYLVSFYCFVHYINVELRCCIAYSALFAVQWCGDKC